MFDNVLIFLQKPRYRYSRPGCEICGNVCKCKNIYQFRLTDNFNLSKSKSSYQRIIVTRGDACTCLQETHTIWELIHYLVNGKKLEVLKEFYYLRTVVTTDNDISREIRRRIVQRNRAYYGLHRLLRSRRLRARTKGEIYHTLIWAQVLYGHETQWSGRVGATHPPDLTVAKAGRIRWQGHVTRMLDCCSTGCSTRIPCSQGSTAKSMNGSGEARLVGDRMSSRVVPQEPDLYDSFNSSERANDLRSSNQRSSILYKS